MSNTYKAIIVATAVVILISGIYILGKLNSVENSSNLVISSSSRSMASSSNAALSSSSVIVSSSSIGVSKIVEAPKTSDVTIISKPQTQCNLPESENLVKTENGCFLYSVGGRFLSGSQPFLEGELKDLEKNSYVEVAKTYYKKNKPLIDNKLILLDYPLRHLLVQIVIYQETKWKMEKDLQ
jgi:small nuclear ribonucleoprotein (snRNP)-like protein